MPLDAIEFRPIGLIHTPFKDLKDMPIQPAGARGVAGTIEIFPEFTAGLQDLGGFSHIMLLYHFHRAKQPALVITPYMDNKPHGIFATRMPPRPNPIGISVVRLVSIEGATLRIENIDVLDGTPILDIKPYVRNYDVHPCEHEGWLDGISQQAAVKRSDRNFD